MDLAQIRHVARLAELRLDEKEEEELTAQVGRIVDFFKELDAVDVSNVPPTSHVTAAEQPPLRPDEVVPGVPHDEALAAAPHAAHGGFAVPTFVE
ncbi:MAG: Asp-tRNA(Asn)/Glu-tRNA(Gln) amidotransferase subunit GatC [Labilithrix sp.]|nr:Asp-tRNA(Asn)/Glu-tRNA(Gln) amidotransferase subunit GatC [Labilithrix sp.]MCW5814062.1 Asp-tRNA(Asn)/Glu-tRNA(Gln) amidotransferase subunit GatC [Labilithrix sp.]